MRQGCNYYAIEYTEYSTELRKRALIGIAKSETLTTAEKAIWGDSRMNLRYFENMAVLKEYGTNRRQARYSFDKDFPPAPIDLDAWTMAKDIRGWLSPDGKLYRAEFMNHTGTAEDLVRGYRIKARGYRQSEAEDILYVKGWICVGMVCAMNNAYGQKRDKKPTAAQITMLQRMRDANQNFPHYQDMIDMFFRMYRIKAVKS